MAKILDLYSRLTVFSAGVAFFGIGKPPFSVVQEISLFNRKRILFGCALYQLSCSRLSVAVRSQFGVSADFKGNLSAVVMGSKAFRFLFDAESIKISPTNKCSGLDIRTDCLYDI